MSQKPEADFPLDFVEDFWARSRGRHDGERGSGVRQRGRWVRDPARNEPDHPAAFCHRSKLNQPRMVEMTQPVNLALGVLKREAFFFQTSPIATSYNGLD
jgi:hypothetical protein